MFSELTLRSFKDTKSISRLSSSMAVRHHHIVSFITCISVRILSPLLLRVSTQSYSYAMQFAGNFYSNGKGYIWRWFVIDWCWIVPFLLYKGVYDLITIQELHAETKRFNWFFVYLVVNFLKIRDSFKSREILGLLYLQEQPLWEISLRIYEEETTPSKKYLKKDG